MLYVTLNALSALLSASFNHLFPKLLPLSCVLCHHTTASSINICSFCIQNLPFLTNNCQQCGYLLPASINSPLICGHCLKKPPPIEKTFALFNYTPPIMQFITRLKFQHQLVYADLLGYFFMQQMAQNWYHTQALPDLIIPMPLHRERLKIRGFNQALEIARPIAKKFKIPIDMKGCVRYRATRAQSELNARDRHDNIKHAFLTNRDYSGLSVAILDDVMTTGYTMFELANLLKQQGAKQVVAWCCARAELK